MKNKMIRFWLIVMLVCSMALYGCGSSSETTAAPETVKTEAAKTETAKQEAAATTQAPATQAPETKAVEDETESSMETETEPETTAAPVDMYTLENLTMRASASKDGEKLGVVPINTRVAVFDTSQDYFQVEYEGQVGYVLGTYLTEDQEAAKQAAAEKKKEEAKEREKSGGDDDEEGQGMADKCNTDGLVGE